MTFTLSNSQLELSVLKTGLEICSVISQKTGTEYIWQADPEIWGSHAPVLFPIIGALKNGQYRFRGKMYSLPKHGLVRHSDKARLTQHNADSLSFSLTWDEESLERYPFKFEFITRYLLSGSALFIEHTVINHGNGPMYFSLGGHPAFNCPLYENESYSDYYLEFDQQETDFTWLLNSDGLVSNERRPILNKSNILPLHDNLFDDDALIFKNLKSRRAALVSKTSGRILSLEYDDFPYLGIWAKPGAPFICIEPWQGIADSADSTQDLTQKKGIMSLDGGKEHTADYSITFHPEIKV